MSVNESLKELVSALFDASGDFDDVENVDALKEASAEEFKEALIAEKEENRNYSDKIDIRMNTSHDEDGIAYALFEKWVQLKNTMGEEFNDFFDRMFHLTNTIGVWGGDGWGVRITPNNAILFRNHHRVVAIDDTPSGRISVKGDDAIAALKEIADYFEQTTPEKDESAGYGDYDERYMDFSILHHMGKDKGISWQMGMPENPHQTGQTVFFISSEMRNKFREEGVCEGNLFLKEEYDHMFESSRSGIYAIRVFSALTIVNGMFRASDDYDTLVEYYTSYFDGIMEDESQHTVLDTYKDQVAEVKERAKNEAENDVADFISGVPGAKELMDKYDAEKKEKEGHVWIPYAESFAAVMPEGYGEMYEFLEDKLTKTATNEISRQLYDFQPWFSEDPSEPCSYGNVKMQFKKTTEEYGGQVVIVSAQNYGVASGVDSLKEALNAVYYGMDSYLRECDVWVDLDVDGGLYGDNREDDVREASKIEWSNLDEIDHKLCEISEKMRNMMEEYEQEDEEEFLRYECEYGFRMIFALKNGRELDFENIHNAMMETTEEYEWSLSVYVPAVGLLQGYCEGELDTGNVNTFYSTGW